jgi:hypothetical protein
MRRRISAVATLTVAAGMAAVVLASTAGATHLSDGWGHAVNESADTTTLTCTNNSPFACFKVFQGGAGHAVTAENDGTGDGLSAVSLALNGVSGRSFAPTASGVYGQNFSGGYGVAGRTNGVTPNGINTGVLGEVQSTAPAAGATAVRGSNLAANANGYGVFGSHNGGGLGVLGFAATGAGIVGTTSSPNGIGVVGYVPGGTAGYFVGDVAISGTLTKGAGAFRIDHPLAPGRMYLQHSFVESPEMKNVYDGIVTTDRLGFATVQLPRYFSALNRSFRYQLTPIGRDAWDARAGIWQELRKNRFVIRSEPRTKISWQVTGIRRDPYANAHRIRPEIAKSPDERDRYLAPELYGKAPSASLFTPAMLPSRR